MFKFHSIVRLRKKINHEKFPNYGTLTLDTYRCHKKRYSVFKAFLDILEHWEVEQMIRDMLRDVLKKRGWLSARQHPKTVWPGKKIATHATVFETFLM